MLTTQNLVFFNSFRFIVEVLCDITKHICIKKMLALYLKDRYNGLHFKVGKQPEKRPQTTKG